MANILVVDDEMGIRELLSEILGDEGHVVTTAENAQEARELMKSSSPELILLDIWMPDTDGVTLLKEWQRDNMLSMPVIMMSGHATIDTAVEATRIGALNFLEKPIALQKLLKTVQQGLAHKGEVAARAVSYLRPNTMHGSPVLTQVLQPAASFSPPPANFAVHSVHTQFPPINTNTTSISFDLPLREARDAFERAYFEYHLSRENGSMTRVAERTGLERTHLYRKLKQLGVEPGKAARRAAI
jgi:DNA-binding NtrC family response regulator